MAWRVANSLNVLLKQVNDLAPNRDKSSDGSIGDEHHATRSSDHNPWVTDGGIGVVTARDFTNDPAHGMSSQALADALLASKDSRIKYVISNRRIASGTEQGNPAWVWRPYSGMNPHNHHCHISVKPDKAHYDNEEPWRFTLVTSGIPVAVDAPKPEHGLLRQGDKGEQVAALQSLLNSHGANIPVDGDFGPRTAAALRVYQTSKRLVADGIAGRYTWETLEA